jgi:hypothetical protein
VIVIENARNVVLDLDGVSLRGTKPGTDLDRNEGLGIVLRDCEDVTVRGGTLGGYKVCIAAFGCSDLRLENIAFDGWYGMRLLSTSVAENEADWLWPHENDDGEWMENYGAAIALTDCEAVTIQGCRGRHGQNGILLTRTDDCTIFDCDFSFLSGWGLAMYRASHNKVSRCIFDYCVRGYSHDVYWRGQDSAGILMFERSCDNVFVECSATHGGDGVFLYGGNDTVKGRAFERGEMDAGGSDRNVWYACDFSYAVANGIEATFSSDNWAIGNKLSGAHQHGVWGGYSARMVVLENEIANVIGGGVSIEHGQECAIVGNVIQDDDIGVELWWDEDPELVGGPFGEHRDTSSRGHWISGNTFDGNARDLAISMTKDLVYRDNATSSTRGTLAIEGVTATDVEGRNIEPRPSMASPDGRFPSGHIRESTIVTAAIEEPEIVARAREWSPPTSAGKLVTSTAERGEKAGLDTIVMGEWGPWDFRSGDPKPRQAAPGGLFAGARWSVAWFRWAPEEPARPGVAKKGSDPRVDLERWRALAGTPVATAYVAQWTDPWGASKEVRDLVGRAHFGLVATTTLDVEEGGKHRLTVTSDDGVRVLVDGEVVLENWTWHGPTRDIADIELAAGAHEVELEYFQIDGAVALSLELQKAGP